MASRAAILDRFITRKLPVDRALPLYQCLSCHNRYIGTDADMEDHARWEGHRSNDPNKLQKADGLYPGFLRVVERNKPTFYCQVCSVFIGTEREARFHQSSRGHLARAQDKSVGQVGRAELEPLPAPSSDGLAAINAAIDELFETKRMKPEDLAKRKAIIASLQSEIRRNPALGSLELQLFGSSCSGFGTPTSDLDVVITSPDWDPMQFINARKTAGEQAPSDAEVSESDAEHAPAGAAAHGAAEATRSAAPVQRAVEAAKSPLALPPALAVHPTAAPPNPGELPPPAAATVTTPATATHKGPEEAMASLSINP